jgi:hypothetical protein|tara:strand:- start:4255 stop:4422 length:168 start_codon:yes stop_codon:yes gene_type:complete
MKYYENIASELDDLLIHNSRFIKKRYKLNQKQMSKVIETWSQGISIRYLETKEEV